ncbi:MAG TPA: RES family NAD+ phosphorylase [Usitatibacter sp.]|jgi:RES domain-containing protein
MQAFRIVKERHVLTAFSGDGARAYGGRWNRPGVPMVYAAQTRALAALEALAHFAGAERRISFVTFEIEVPDSLVIRVSPAELPTDWRSEEPRPSTQDLGSDWQLRADSVALLVPSVLIPQEYCLLLNPEHRDTRKVMIRYPEPFRFDGRL